MDWSFNRILVTFELLVDGLGQLVEDLGTLIRDTVDGFVEIILPDWILNMTILDFMLSVGLATIIAVILIKFFIGIFT